MSNHWYNYRGPASKLLVVVEWVGRAAQRCGHHHLRPEGCIGDRVACFGERNFPSDWDRAIVGGQGSHRCPGVCVTFDLAKSNTELVSMFSDTGGGGGGGRGSTWFREALTSWCEGS